MANFPGPMPAPFVGAGVATSASATSIVTGGTAVTVFPAGTIINGADVQNPSSATEPLYVDLVQTAVIGAPTSFQLAPGQSYHVPGPMVKAITAIAATTGHSFIAVSY